MFDWRKKTYADEQYELPFGDVPFIGCVCQRVRCQTYTDEEKRRCRLESHQSKQ